MIQTYQLKPVRRRAVPYDGSGASRDAVLAFAGAHASLIQGQLLVIHTPRGQVWAEPGDWIVEAGPGDYFPCKPDVFEATYEAAPPEES